MPIPDFQSAMRPMMVFISDGREHSMRVLQAQPGYLEARDHKRDRPGREEGVAENASNQTPEEAIETAYLSIRESLGEEILTKLKTASPGFFERLVVELLVKMGYGGSLKDAGKAIGKSGDEGLDGVIKEDRLGLDAIYIQAKKWENPVGRPEIQKFAGALQGVRAKKGIFITTSGFTLDAKDYAAKIDSKIVLIDGEQLWNLMVDFGIGVSVVAAYEIKKIDNDYFEDAD